MQNFCFFYLKIFNDKELFISMSYYFFVYYDYRKENEKERKTEKERLVLAFKALPSCSMSSPPLNRAIMIREPDREQQDGQKEGQIHSQRH